MAIAKKLKFHEVSISVIRYIFGDNPKSKKDINTIRFIGGNQYSENPFEYNRDGLAISVNTEDLVEEFDLRSKAHKGKGSKFIGHYVVSLSENETLTDDQWFQALQIFVEEHGYQSAKYVGVVHMETDIEHMHIATNRVNTDGSLVSDKNDYDKNVKAARRIEKKLGLKVTINPEDIVDKQLNRDQFEAINEAEEKGEKILDQAVLIRQRLSFLNANSKAIPETMTDFANKLKEVGVDFEVQHSGDCVPVSIKYKLSDQPDARWISGTTIKKTRTTWSKLISNVKISYVPSRDNVALGLLQTNVNTTALNEAKEAPVGIKDAVERKEAVANVCFSVNLNRSAMNRLTTTDLNYKLYNTDKKGMHRADFEIEVKYAHDFIQDTAAWAEFLQKIIEFIIAIIKMLFGVGGCDYSFCDSSNGRKVISVVNTNKQLSIDYVNMSQKETVILINKINHMFEFRARDCEAELVKVIEKEQEESKNKKVDQKEDLVEVDKKLSRHIAEALEISLSK